MDICSHAVLLPSPPLTCSSATSAWRLNVRAGVCFTRNPSNGEKRLYGEYLINAQVRTKLQAIK